MKKIIIILLLLLTNFCFAHEINIYDFTPETKGYLNINNGFSVQIIPSKNNVAYNIFNNLKGSVDVVAWKTDKEYVTIVARLRGWNTDKTAEYYSILIDGRTSKTSASSTLLSQLPDLSDYHLNSARTNDAAINLRSESNVKSKKVGQYQKNNSVIFTGKTENKCSIDDANDYWFSIDYSGTPAWIYGKYITFAGSADISLESLGLIKIEKSETKTVLPNSVLKLNCVSNSSASVYNIYKKDDTLIKIENNSYYQTGSINIKKGNKQIADIGAHQYSVYSSKFNKLFYITYLMDSRSFAYSLDCNTENGEQLKDIHNSELTPYYSKIFLSNDETKLFAVDCTYTYEDISYLELVEIDVATNKILHTYISDYSPFICCTFGKLNDEIFYFVIDPRNESVPNTIKFVKLQGNKLTEIASFNYEDYNFKVEYADEISPVNLHKSDYAILISHCWRNDKTLIFEYKDGKVVECSSKIKGNVLTSLYQNDNWYLLTGERKTGTIRLYDSKLNELTSQVHEDYKDSSYYFTKAGFDNAGNLTVIFEFSK